eukprot:CAMPEP_0197888482 /NCGR_PEP_ID=MMETSP1439-20131203/22012_1 /TAXON_ID=66791 /ORGANISM="Gonyaulax spinifera, Strain CCMP409" /LENGTH=170 /DNA_ID=CAMNT_0043508395 /DNA_START=59 /DNA_END=568 /DNA_ORIENTATION=-
MVNNRARCQGPLVSAGLLGTGAFCLLSLAGKRQSAPAFLSARSTGVLVNQIHHMTEILQKEVAKYGEGKSKEEVDKYVKEKVPEIGARTIAYLTEKYTSSRDEVEKEVETMKAFYRSQKEMPGKTKADVLKEIWEELPKHTDKPVPPLDEEMLAELAEEPAVIEGEFRHN